MASRALSVKVRVASAARFGGRPYSIKPYRKGQFLFYIGNEAPHHSKYTPLPPAGPRRVAGRELMRLLLLALMEAAAGHAASTQHYNVTGTIDVFTDENT